MEQRSNVTILIILLYCVPYVFLGMYGDKIYHNLWLYGLMIVAMAGLSRYCRKTKRIHIIMIGNLLSFLSSYLLTQYLATENWNYYFKAFPSTIRTMEFSVIMLIMQIIVCLFTKVTK